VNLRQLEKFASSSGMRIDTFTNGVTRELSKIQFAEDGITELDRFAALVRAAALEEAAKALDAFGEPGPATVVRDLK
jgi:hypothetical protein